MAARQPLRRQRQRRQIEKKTEQIKPMASIKPKEPREIIPFFPDNKELNEDFNQDFQSAVAEYDSDARRALKNLVIGYRAIVLRWDYQTALAVLNIADMEIQKMEVLKQFKKKAAGEKNITRSDTEMIKQLGQATKDAKIEIGLDPKNLKGKGDGSLSEAFADVVEKGRFDKRRFVCKVLIGEGKKKDSDKVSADLSAFKNVTDEDVLRYLETPGQE